PVVFLPWARWATRARCGGGSRASVPSSGGAAGAERSSRGARGRRLSVMGRGVVPSQTYSRDMAWIDIVPRGPFSLAAAQDFAGGFPAGIGGGGIGDGSITRRVPRVWP